MAHQNLHVQPVYCQQDLSAHFLGRGADDKDSVGGLLGRAELHVGVVLVGVVALVPTGYDGEAFSAKDDVDRGHIDQIFIKPENIQFDSLSVYSLYMY